MRTLRDWIDLVEASAKPTEQTVLSKDEDPLDETLDQMMTDILSGDPPEAPAQPK